VRVTLDLVGASAVVGAAVAGAAVAGVAGVAVEVQAVRIRTTASTPACVQTRLSISAPFLDMGNFWDLKRHGILERYLVLWIATSFCIALSAFLSVSSLELCYRYHIPLKKSATSWYAFVIVFRANSLLEL
jgi:hypothetical protein